MRASTSRFASDFSRPYFAARWVTRSSLFLSEDRSSSENLPHLARISSITICLVSAADVACPALKFVSKDTLDGEFVYGEFLIYGSQNMVELDENES